MKTVLILLAVAMFAVIFFSLSSPPHYTRFTEKFMTENVTGIMTGKYDNMSFSYRNSDNQEVHAEIAKADGKENYSITLVIVDL